MQPYLKSLQSLRVRYSPSQFHLRPDYGKECFGIVVDNNTEAIELIASKGLRGARVDNMGKRYIVYYPYPDLSDIENELEDTEEIP